MSVLIKKSKAKQRGLLHCIVVLVFSALLGACSDNTEDPPEAQPIPPTAQPIPPAVPTGALIGVAVVFPEYRSVEGYLHVQAFDTYDVDTVAEELSVAFSDTDEGIPFELNLPEGNYGVALGINNQASADWDDPSSFDLTRTYHCDLGAPNTPCSPDGITIIENTDTLINLTLYAPEQDRDLFLQPRTLNVAHGAGQGERPDFTLLAYENLQSLGPHIVFEADINGSADNVPVVMHDATLDRKTNFDELNCPDKEPAPDDKHFTHNDCGRISALTFDEITEYDAGYHWTQDNGETFPYRDQGLTAVSLESLFRRFPDAHYVIELKPEEDDGVGSFTQEDLDTAVEVAQLINDYRMAHRVTVASFTDEIVKHFRQQDDEILTAFSEAEALPLMLAVFSGDDAYEIPQPAGEFLQIPETYSLDGLNLTLVNQNNVDVLLSVFDLRVHVWTINDDEAMDRMLALENLSGIITDYPEKLMQRMDGAGDADP